MKIRLDSFNTYLTAFLLAICCGCETNQSDESNPKKQLSTIRLHMEAVPGTDGALEVPVYRAAPRMMRFEREPILSENNILEATLVDQAGLFAIELKLDKKGTWLLERYSVTGRGLHLGVFSHWGPARWLAAPTLDKVNSSGRILFTPDASKEEADRIVRGLNNARKKLDSKNWFPHE